MKGFKDFWQNLLPSEHNNGCSWENATIDVANKGCFDNYDTTACVRNSLLAFLGFSTLGICIIRISRLHLLHHPQLHQYLIFYMAFLETSLLTVKWLMDENLSQLEFVAVYLKMLQFIVLCHFHWTLVTRILHQKRLITRFIVPVLIALFVFLTAVTVLGIATPFSTWIECLAPHWLLLSIAEFLAVQLYVVAGMYITRKINSVSALDSFKKEQKRDLWSVIATYEFSAVVSVSYFAVMRIIGNDKIGCSGVFGYTQELYSPIFVVFMIVKYLLPVWIMIIVFYPTRGGLSSDEERLLGWSGDGSTTSVFSPETRRQQVYKQLKVPVRDIEGESPPMVSAGLRRSLSSPAFFISNGHQQHLTPISEEDSLLPSSRISMRYGTTSHHHKPMHTEGNVSQVGSKTRERHDSGHPVAYGGPSSKLPVSLNHCYDEIEPLHASEEFA